VALVRIASLGHHEPAANIAITQLFASVAHAMPEARRAPAAASTLVGSGGVAGLNLPAEQNGGGAGAGAGAVGGDDSDGGDDDAGAEGGGDKEVTDSEV